MENLLEVKNLQMHFHTGNSGIIHKTKNYVYAVDGVNFTIKPGETLGLVGESGCGKSTVARAVAQLYKPTNGEVIFDGKDLCQMNKNDLLKARKDMQMVFQDPYASLNPRMTTGNIISEPLRIYKQRGIISMSEAEIDERIEYLMERVGLSKFFKNRYPHEFSGGQRQRIGIARALALKPKLILADEPVSALDVSIQSQILNLFKEVQKEMGLTYLFIAHDLAVIKYISDRIVVMYLGKIMEISDYKDLYANPLHPYTKALLSAAPIPDPEIEEKRQRIILEGDVPSPTKQRKGCYFYDRCPNRFDRCKKEQPQLKQVGKNGIDHQIACWLYEK
ncbi:MAG: peptide ABC transporter ATP-binding protein [Treponema sp. CETP13]|nr:MAG: peptide ABC transporter ATP-binding protein [Treponema sp. CETP13]